MKKECVLCKKVKELESFYKHKLSKDGYLNKCKDCKKSYSREREETLRKDPVWVKKEQERQKDKYSRLGYAIKQKEWDKDKPWKNSSIYKNMNRDNKIQKGYEIHHWSYEDFNLKDFFVLSCKDHRKVHKFLEFQPESKNFKDKLGNLLDTREKHLDYINSVLI